MGRYTQIPIRKKQKSKTVVGKRFYGTTIYPQIPLNFQDTYVFTQMGDRFDILAQQYYGNSNYWWVISIANETLKQSSLYLQPGLQIRIPSQLGAVLSEFNALNGN
jgi:nucleoid-associated protein YgaU|tara:strand:- start:1071 stop:1388 length:318 start_codon:yes stop_codon:yes gene_type:complete